MGETALAESSFGGLLDDGGVIKSRRDTGSGVRVHPYKRKNGTDEGFERDAGFQAEVFRSDLLLLRSGQTLVVLHQFRHVAVFIVLGGDTDVADIGVPAAVERRECL